MLRVPLAVREAALSSVTAPVSVPLITATSLTLLTFRVKVELALARPSLAVTVTDTEPTSLLPGVPDRVPVLASKLSQAGRLLPSARDAL